MCGRRGPLETDMLSPHLRDQTGLDLKGLQLRCGWRNVPVDGDAGAVRLFLNKLQSQPTAL